MHSFKSVAGLTTDERNDETTNTQLKIRTESCAVRVFEGGRKLRNEEGDVDFCGGDVEATVFSLLAITSGERVSQ